MRLIANIARILVGIEFVFSGFVKVVDPYGTGLKLQEYFEVFAEDLPALAGFFEIFAQQSQFLSLVFCAAEMILGVALLVSYKMPKTAWVVLGLMGFFTFLTFYSAFYNKVTDCGCFGDFLKLEPWHSFYKDIVSIAVILVIFIFRKKYNESAFALPVTILGVIVAFGIGIYGKMYLPLIDFLPYAEGLSIKEQMKPTGIKPQFVYTFLNKTSGEKVESAEYLMDTATYKYESSIILNESEIRPKITDYSIGDIDGNDATQYSLEGKKLLICVKKVDKISESTINDLKNLTANLKTADAMIVSSLFSEDLNAFLSSKGIKGTIYTIDEKVLKTMARTNPCVILLDDGIVQKKWSHNQIPSVQEVGEILNIN